MGGARPAVRELAGTYVELTGHVGAVEEAEGTVQLTLEGMMRPAAGRGEAALAGGDRSVSGGRQIPRVLVSWKTDGDGEMPEARDFKIGIDVTVRGQLALFARARNPVSSIPGTITGEGWTAACMGRGGAFRR